MKRLTNLILAVLFSTASFAQNVGINADGSAPDASAMLDVKSSEKGFLPPRVASTGDISTPATGLLVYQTGGTPGYYYYNGSSWIQIGSASSASQWTTTGSDIYYNSGNVGIGTTSPGHKLTISGTGGSNTAALALDITDAGGGYFNWASSAIAPNLPAEYNLIHMIGKAENEKNSGYIGFHFKESGSDDNFLTLGLFNANNLLNITGAGNVGIGTTTPYRLLSLSGTQSVIELYNTGTTTWTGLDIKAKNGAYNAAIGLDDATGIFYVDMAQNATNDLTILQNGNVGIGTTTPGAKLEVAGFGYGVAGGITMTPVNDTEGGHYMTFLNTDNQWIGSIARGAGNTVAYNTSSDYRLKENVKELDIQTTLEKIRHARPVTYTWKSDGSPDVGFIAHELEEAGFDNAVSGEKDALDEKGNILPQAVDYGRITPEILRAVQYLLNENDALQNKIELITAQNSELKSENSGIRAENVEIKKQMESLASDVEALKSVVYGTAQANYNNLKNE